MIKKIVLATSLVALLSSCVTTGTNNNSTASGIQLDLFHSNGDKVYFALDRDTLSSESKATLDKQSEWLKKHPKLKVLIEGHTDSRASTDYNIALGHKRADTVKKYLVAHGVDESRISITSYGKSKPASRGNNDCDHSKNRRAVITIVDKH